MARPESNPLWTYSLRLYRRPGIAPACIALQDRIGLDVNMLLFCLWAADSGRTLTPKTMRLATELSRLWSTNVVGPLRQTRRFLKPLELPKLRGAIARIELSAERVEQDLLVRIAPRAKPGRHVSDAAAVAAANLALYLQHRRTRLRRPDLRALLAILGVAFSDGAFPKGQAAVLRRRLS